MLLVSYVKNNAFPQPLTEEEELKHLKQMAEGNQWSRNMLIEHNLRLVAHIVKKFDNTGEDLEDLISIGTIGLIKAIESFSPDKGTKLATFAARCIENEIVRSIGCGKKWKKRKKGNTKNFIQRHKRPLPCDIAKRTQHGQGLRGRFV
nr:sigma-70 family RNA polymerase sigma factor [Paenibacillus turpanensis]